MSFRSVLRRAASPVLVFAAALVLLFEDFVWDSVAALVARIARLRLIAALEARIARLGPYPAMALFVIPVLVILPFKLYGTWLIASGHVLTGVAVIVVAKLGGTVFLTRLFHVCRPQLLRVVWFARLHDWLLRTKERVYARLHAMPAWIAAARMVAALRQRLAALRAALRAELAPRRGSGPFLAARFRAARRLLRDGLGRSV